MSSWRYGFDIMSLAIAPLDCEIVTRGFSMPVACGQIVRGEDKRIFLLQLFRIIAVLKSRKFVWPDKVDWRYLKSPYWFYIVTRSRG